MRRSLSLSDSLSQAKSHMQCCQLDVVIASQSQNKPNEKSSDFEQMLETVLQSIWLSRPHHERNQLTKWPITDHQCSQWPISDHLPITSYANDQASSVHMQIDLWHHQTTFSNKDFLANVTSWTFPISLENNTSFSGCKNNAGNAAFTQ